MIFTNLKRNIGNINNLLVNILNLFVPNAPFLHPLKTSETRKFPDVFKG